MAPIPISCSKSDDTKKGNRNKNKNRGKPKEDDQDENISTKTKSRSKMAQIVSSDNVYFRVDELTAMESSVMHNYIEYGFNGFLPLKFTSEILSKAIEFCKKHAEIRNTNEKQHAQEKILMEFNSEFLKQNQSDLINLLVAACGLQMRSLIDVTSEALVDMIIGKTPEKIHKMFNMKQDLTLEEVVEVFEMDDWCFE